MWNQVQVNVAGRPASWKVVAWSPTFPHNSQFVLTPVDLQQNFAFLLLIVETQGLAGKYYVAALVVDRMFWSRTCDRNILPCLLPIWVRHFVSADIEP